MTQSNTSASAQRMPSIMNKDDFEALTHLSEEERARGIDTMSKITLNPAWGILGSDPDLQRLMHMLQTGLVTLLSPDTQFRPGSPMNLIAIEVARRYGCEWQLSALCEIAYRNGESDEWKDENFSSSALGVLDHPESQLWNEEQRLTLRLVDAILENDWTDELVKEAREMWGDKKFLRLIMWVAYCLAWPMIIQMANMPFAPFSGTAMVTPKKMLEKGFQAMKDTIWAGMQRAVDEQPGMMEMLK
ncbi:MAG: hypothetical protein HKP58_07815 [Desulfatitalea sp.]|nr:hypothetical protein [Desulfatitalea sp.]NNK00306.1 hypothetical protein [Desulfatitalea sp.]